MSKHEKRQQAIKEIRAYARQQAKIFSKDV